MTSGVDSTQRNQVAGENPWGENPFSRSSGASDSDKEKKAGEAPADPLANKETFLQLLVAQIKNQNPLNPADGVEFLSQLAQFTELEQMLAVRSDVHDIRNVVAADGETESETAADAGVGKGE